MGKDVLLEGEGIEHVDHPSFDDLEYKQRRFDIMNMALDYKFSDPEIPRVDYTSNERLAWSTCFKALKEIYRTAASESHNEAMVQMEKHCGFSEQNVPQLEDIS